MGKSKDPNKPKGRMSSYAFFVQTCREEHRKKHPDEQVVFAEFSRKCADKWKSMGPKEKGRFEDMAAKDKARYEREMTHYNPPAGEKGGRKRRRTKDPNAPKRALSAFFCFCADERPKVRAMYPDYQVGDVAKELGKRWEVCREKPKYEGKAAEEKARYAKAMAAYKGGASAAATAPKKAKVVAPAAADDDDDDEDDDDDDDEEDEESD